MTVDAMRSALAEVYIGPRWKYRVKAMPDDQVVAIYKRMERSGKLNKERIHILDKKPDLERLSVDEEGRLIYCANAW